MRVARSATLLLALLPAVSWAQQTSEAASTASDAASSEEAVTSKVPLEEIRRYVAVYNAVRAAYVDPVDDKKLMQSAIRGLLLDLDPHSTYFDKEDAEAFDEQATGAYDGIGVELQQQPDNSSLKVISPIDDTPATRAGIRAGDLIIAIDGKPISAIQATEPLRGKAGSKVVLTLVREGRAKPFDVTVTRQTIRVTSVRSRMLEPGYGYIRLSTFQADTGADFQKHVGQLQQQAGGEGDHDGWSRASALFETLGKQELLEVAGNELLHRLFHEENPDLLGERPLRFDCSCSRERVEGMLESLGETEARAAAEPTGAVDVRCEFCGREYHFPLTELVILFSDTGLPSPAPERLQ